MKYSIYTLLILSSFPFSSTFSQTFTSGEQRVNLIELYTSEGCSSCPPADNWLNSLKNNSQLWSEFIPMAFHVDYWDYIGWKDPFAQTKFSNRQRQYKQQGSVSGVYTPGMMFNGREWTSWRKKTALPSSKNMQAGILNTQLVDNSLNANYQSPHPQAELYLNVAVLGFDLVVDINAGENNGRTLKHDFVVMSHQKVAMHDDDNGLHSIRPTQLDTTATDAPRMAVVTWVTSKESLTPLQSTGGFIQ